MSLSHATKYNVIGLALAVFIGAGAYAAPASGPSAAAAKPPAAPPAAPLQFKDIGKLVGWLPVGDSEMAVQAAGGQWYRVRLYEPCMKLYPGKTPSFVTETDENQERSSAVMIERRKCIVTEIAKRPPPSQ